MENVFDHTHGARNSWITHEGRSAAAAFFAEEAHREEVRVAEAMPSEQGRPFVRRGLRSGGNERRLPGAPSTKG